MRTFFWAVPASTAFVLALTTTTVEAGDAAKGEKVFAKCKACHEASTDKNKVGPSLKGLFGRKAGSIEGYAYSAQMKALGITWNEETLKPYLTDPKAVVPGGKMAFVGLKKEEDVENVIEYLKEATK
jgi:cytochrome c